jgi:hypothetical protein
MGLSSSKTKTTQDTNQSQSGTTNPITPDWLLDRTRQQDNRIGDYANSDPYSYIAGPAPLQQAAWGSANTLGDWQPQARLGAGLALEAGTGPANTAGVYGGSSDVPLPLADKSDGFSTIMSGPQVAQGPQQSPMGKGVPGRATETGGFLPQGSLVPANGYSPAPNDPNYAMPRSGQPFNPNNPAITGADQLGAYQNPFQQQVIDTTLAGYDQDAGQRQAALMAQGARNGAFGSSRFGIAQGQLGADLTLGRGQLEGGLRSQGFNTAAGYGMQDAAAGNQMRQFDAQQRDAAQMRQLQAAGLLQQGASQYGADQRADIGLMSGLGDQQRQIEQAYLGAPVGQLEEASNLYGQTPYQILVGNQVDTTGRSQGTTVQRSSPSLFQSLLQGAGAASMFF